MNTALDTCTPVNAPTYHIIGVLGDGSSSLCQQALRCLQNADVVIGAVHLLALVHEHIKASAQCYELDEVLAQVPLWIDTALSQQKQLVVLASGDPLCYGIGGYLSKNSKYRATVIPNLSAVQLACARIHRPWQNIKLISVHHRDDGEWTPTAGPEHHLYPIIKACHTHAHMAIFTSPENSPDRIARLLLAAGLADSVKMVIFEKLGGTAERIVDNCSVSDIAKITFSAPNLVLLWRMSAVKSVVRFGLDDENYQPADNPHSLLTKRDVRAVTLAQMQLCSDSIVWDIGAGFGALGLEAARLCPDGYVYAIEKNPKTYKIALQNAIKLGVYNYSLVLNKAPHGMEHWPAPDAVFIGGSDGQLTELMRLSLHRLKNGGFLLMNFVTLENLHSAIACLKKWHVPWKITQLQSAQTRPILNMHRFVADNPVWMMSVQTSSLLKSQLQ
ncbi:bifunctional cobalt-precorrin-7 (C(5))-methyltransferase/cobalt-precorrin-6B (C(15))-methyltransferase [Thiorhodospira sibirica]|uniref:bifunctional cobalt-precorrin-7 (C(5))-methyltransferase/cobalt-precorrin-6B (C(15))-methyltransferase n=1 Tax=Thiorhodospira sibirica TaxID=154347 RepID=UPI00022C4C73|nr:bifunctional cobalt-precorrin-7 (C(5))-methyltransferase/cobalt-precorrin-6B (C(15))-methyltransferase [Thiorhodospira sibirica]